MSENALSLSGSAALPAPRPVFERALALLGRAPGAYAVLEARRNRLLYAGWPAVILGSLPLAAAVAMSAEYPALQGVAAALLGWAVAGLPLTALLFGAVAGAGLRGSAQDAEAALPVSPRARACGALASAAGALAASTALVAGLIVFAAPDAASLLRAMSEVGSNTWSRTHWEVMFSVLTSLYCAPLALFWLLLASFGVSLVSAHAVLGGVAALFAAAAALTPILAGLMLQMNTEGTAGFLFPAAACTSALAAGALAAVGGAAAPALREGRWRAARVLTLALLPLAGSFAAWPALYRARDRALAATETVVSAWDRTRGEEARRRTAAVRRSLGGRLVLERPQGDLVLLAGWTPTLADLVWGKRLSEIHQVFWDSKGMLWVEAWHPGTQGNLSFSEIYVGRGDGPLRRYLTLPYRMRFGADNDRAFIDPEGWAYDSGTLIYLDPDKAPVLKRQ